MGNLWGEFMKRKILENHNGHLNERGDIIHMPLKNGDAYAFLFKPSFPNPTLQRTTNWQEKAIVHRSLFHWIIFFFFLLIYIVLWSGEWKSHIKRKVDDEEYINERINKMILKKW
jgi:hypothetical protein